MHKVAERIIAKCGGHQVIADDLGLNIATIYRWTYTKESGGTDGLIPSKYHSILIQKALKRKICLAHADFFDPVIIPKRKTVKPESAATVNPA